VNEVAFHFNAADKVGYACRLLRKVWGRGRRVVVVGDPDSIGALDDALWTFSAADFLPHCVAGAAPPRVLARSPLVLAPDTRSAPHHDVLVNLTHDVPDAFEGFDRLIEIVSTEEEDRMLARRRWMHYKHRGLPLVRHDLAESRG
jgi:DNA polymerase III subunit chi